MEKTIRSPIACRILPDLRQQLELEAAEGGHSLSSYMESILMHRSAAFTVNETPNEVFEAMQKQIDELKSENERLSNLPQPVNADLKVEYDALPQTPVVNALPSWWSLENYRAAMPYLKELKSKHPNCTIEQLLLSAFAVTTTNENNWVEVYTLNDFWKRNPHFLNLQTQTAKQ